MARKIRVVIAKPGLDGHDRGAKIIARALRDAGMEVIYTGLHQTPEQIVETAVQEDADAVGISILSGAHMTLVPKILDGLRENGGEDVLVVVGGTIPTEDAAELKQQGVAEVFTPGAPTMEIVDFLRARVPASVYASASSATTAVATVVVDRPDAMNALDVATLTELRERLTSCATTTSVRAVVLTGAGDRAFIAGADIKYMSALGREAAKEWGGLGHEVATAARDDAQADDRRDQRLRARRRLRARARVRHPLRVAAREARPAGDQPRDHPRLGRDAAARARVRDRLREGADPHGPGGRRGGGAASAVSSTPCTTRCSRRRSRRRGCSRRRARSRSRPRRRATNRALQGDHGENLRSEADTSATCSRREDAKEGLTAFIEKREPKFAGRYVAVRASVSRTSAYADPHAAVRVAQAAEAAGWDGFFMWDHLAFVWGRRPPIRG